MASTPEAKVKAKVRTILKQYDAYHFMPATGGYGTSGVPDIVGCYRGCFFAIECKAGKNTTTPLQELALSKIRQAGGWAIVVNETNINEVTEWLKQRSLHQSNV